jgi:hypothetical protein
MKGNKNIRIVLTAAVLLLGGYYIQQSSTGGTNNLSAVVDNAKADVPCCSK